MERTPCKYSICGSEDHLIAKFPKAPKENEKHRKQVHFSERGNHASQKYCNNSKHNNDQNIYASMVHMYDNDRCYSRDFGDIFQLTNWILDS